MDSQTQYTPHALPVIARLKFTVGRFFLWLVIKCTTLNGLYRLGQVFGICEWALNRRRRKRYHRRMKQIFGEEYQPAIMKTQCRRYFMRTRCDKLYYLAFDLIPRDQILQRIHLPQRCLIEASLADGCGVYLAISHLGAQHVAGLLMCFLGYPLAGVRDRNESALRQYIQQRFASRFSEVGATKMFFTDAFPRNIYRWFQGNGLLASALDSDPSSHSQLSRIGVRVFGEDREYLTGTMQIALRCKAAILQAFIVSKPNFHYVMTVTEPLVDPQSGSDSPAVLQEVMQAYASNIEAHALQHPDHMSRI